MISMIEAILLSIVQGITEWLPISSSGHLALLQSFFGFQSLEYDIFLHLSSMLAVIFVFWKDIFSILKGLNKKKTWNYIGLIIVGLIPIVIVGFFLKDFVESFFVSDFYLGLFFMFSGIVIFSSKFSKPRKKAVGFFDSIFIGCFQAIAILPGVSRSGFTISSGLIKGIGKEAVVKFSFLMSIPAIFGAFILTAKDAVFFDINWSILLVSFLVTFFVSIFTIKFLLRIIKGDNFYLFGIYNLVLGVLILFFS